MMMIVTTWCRRSPDGEQGVDHGDVALDGHGDCQVHGHHQARLQLQKCQVRVRKYECRNKGFLFKTF